MSESTNVADALAAIEAFFEALRAEQWEAAAEFVDSRAAASFRELELRSLTGWAQHRDAILAAQRSGEGSVGWSSSGRLDYALLEQLGPTPLRGLPGIDTLADLVALSQRTFVARCLEIANARLTTPTGERIESRRHILGGVSDGDSIVPGQIALQRMPCLMKSAATALVRPMTAAVVAP